MGTPTGPPSQPHVPKDPPPTSDSHEISLITPYPKGTPRPRISHETSLTTPYPQGTP